MILLYAAYLIVCLHVLILNTFFLQALQFSSAAVRVHKGSVSSEKPFKEMLTEQKVILENLSQDLDNERAQHSEALAKLQKTQIELQMVKASMQSLDEKILK